MSLPFDLRCEYFSNPLGLTEKTPRLSWRLPASCDGQTGWHIQAASTSHGLSPGDLWDSGPVESQESHLIPYGGPALTSRQRVTWRVRIRDGAGRWSDWSDPAWWEMGLLERSDWTAQWISSSLVGTTTEMVPVPLFRKEFNLPARAVWARASITALGAFQLRLNGRVVGDDVLAPGWTDFRKRVSVRTYDVTDLLEPGPNCAAAVLGDGWYSGFLGYEKRRQFYGDRPHLLVQINCILENGQHVVLETDNTWQTAEGPWRQADMQMGEIYDATREEPGWDRCGFAGENWQPVHLTAFPDLALESSAAGPVRRHERLKPVETQRIEDELVIDFGQNLVGRLRMRVSGPRGSRIVMRHAEMRNPDGSLYTENLRSAKSEDIYILGGDKEETFEPEFTFHGFRYAGLTFPEDVTIHHVEAVVIRTQAPEIGEFTCSESLINQLQKNIRWGQRGNFLEVPTDCPQRDERLGWTGDAQVFIATACFNASVAPIFNKWFQDLRDAQSEEGFYPAVAPNVAIHGKDGGPAWADAGVICPWATYVYFGDRRVLERHFDSARRFVDSLQTSSQELIRCHPDFVKWGGFGDWLAKDGGGTEGTTPKDLIGTAYFAESARILSRICAVLDRPGEAADYQKLANDVRAAFQKRFISNDSRVLGETQTGAVLALRFGLVDDHQRAKVAERLVADIHARGTHLSTGFVGTPHLLQVLTETGHLPVAYDLLLQTTFPSWLFQILCGATTIWERWDGWTPDQGFQDAGMNSFNHYAYGAVGNWLYETVAGLRPDENQPGFRRAIIRPHPGTRLDHAAVSYDSVHGPWSCGWHREPDGSVRMQLAVPPGCSALVHTPIFEGGPEKLVGEVGPGRHEWTFSPELAPDRT